LVEVKADAQLERIERAKTPQLSIAVNKTLSVAIVAD
jgi:hypothetical protein